MVAARIRTHVILTTQPSERISSDALSTRPWRPDSSTLCFLVWMKSTCFILCALQMRDIVGAAGATKGAFRRRMDNTMALLNNWKIPEELQRRVRLWFMYAWDRRELLGKFWMQFDVSSGLTLHLPHTDGFSLMFSWGRYCLAIVVSQCTEGWFICKLQ